MSVGSLENVALGGLARLAGDAKLYELLEREHERQSTSLSLIAAASAADPAVFACQGSSAGNVTAEGYPGARYHGGCEVVDEIEKIAIERAKVAFGAQYANVQPHSGTSANLLVLFSLLQPGDVLLGMDLNAGGHLTHGSRASVTGQVFHAASYGVGADGLIDYAEVARVAHQARPKLIVAGASAYPRTIDFARFRAIADEVDALLLADVSHIAGLVAAGHHPSPIDHAHFTTTSTYKQLYGPRGGLVLMGKDHARLAPKGKQTLAETVQRATFPFFQGTPSFASIAAKAHALGYAATPGFREMLQRVLDGARVLGASLAASGYQVLTGGTDNHIVLVDLANKGMTGLVAERALEACGINVNRNRIPGDKRSALVTSGLRFGTNVVAARGFGPEQFAEASELVQRVLAAVRPTSDTEYTLDEAVRSEVRGAVSSLCARFPLPGYAGGAAG